MLNVPWPFWTTLETMTDARVVRTRAALHRAVLNLASAKHISTVTVSELAAEAGINRVTFYKHYATPSETLADVIGGMLAETDSGRETRNAYADESTPRILEMWEGFTHLVDHVEDNHELYRLGFEDPLDGTVREALTKHAYESLLWHLELRRNWATTPADIDIDMVAWVLASALATAIGYWLGDASFTREDLRANFGVVYPEWMRTEPDGTVLDRGALFPPLR